MKDIYLFLDVDGVLNNGDSFRREYHSNMSVDSVYHDIDFLNFMRLKQFLKETPQCRVILSSSWRHLKEPKERLEKLFSMHGLHIEDCTPALYPKKRGDEIQYYIDTHGILDTQIVILDDDCDMTTVEHRLVRTDFYHGGLLETHIQQMKDLLSLEKEKIDEDISEEMEE